MVQIQESTGKKMLNFEKEGDDVFYDFKKNKKIIIPSWIPFTCETDQLVLVIGESSISSPQCKIQYSINDIMGTSVLSDQIMLYVLQEQLSEQEDFKSNLCKNKTIKNFWKWTFNLTWFIRKKYFPKLNVHPSSLDDTNNTIHYNNTTLSLIDLQNKSLSFLSSSATFDSKCRYLCQILEQHKNICMEMSKKVDIDIMNDENTVIIWWIVSIYSLELINQMTDLLEKNIFDSILKNNNDYDDQFDILPLSFNKIQFVLSNNNPCFIDSSNLLNSNNNAKICNYENDSSNSIIMYLDNYPSFGNEINEINNDFNDQKKKITPIHLKSCLFKKNKSVFKKASFSWSKDVNDYQIVKPLGKGSGGFVREAIYKKTGQKVIIKYVVKSLVLRGCWIQDKENGKVPTEIYILNKIAQDYDQVPEFIQNLLTYWEDQIYYYLVFSYTDFPVDLFDYIDKIPGDTMPEDEAKKIFKNVAKAVQFLHKNNIVHRDIKDENILIDEKTKDIQLIDFGSSAYCNSDKKFNTFVGSLLFAAPEIIKGLYYNGPPQDIWSLGILLYTMIYKVTPFSNYYEILRNTPTFNKNISDDCKDLILWMINRDVTQRPNIDQVLKHKWLL